MANPSVTPELEAKFKALADQRPPLNGKQSLQQTNKI